MTAQQRQGVGELEDRSGRLALVHGALREFIYQEAERLSKGVKRRWAGARRKS